MHRKSLLIDLYKLKNRYSGLGEFSFQFHRHLNAAAADKFELSFLKPKRTKLETASHARYPEVSFQKRFLPAFNQPYDLWHSLQQFPSHQPNSKTPWLLTIHDLNFLTEKNQSKAKGYLRSLQKNINRADYISTISAYTRDQVKEHLNLQGKEPTVIHNGVSLKEYPNIKAPDYLGGKPYFFSIGIFSAKKNFASLLPLLQHFPDHKLVLAGNNGTPYGTLVKEKVKELKLEERVIFAGLVSDKEKYALYTHSKAFLFPSLAEGFGLPVIEAMLAGVPVFLSNQASLPEIGSTHAFYWENLEPEAMVKALQAGLQQFEKESDTRIARQKEYARSFSWERCINAYIDLYHSILDHS